VVLGDNPAESYDSRAFGYVRADQLLGRVIGDRARRVLGAADRRTGTLGGERDHSPGV
jgi:hypothetical protein